ncbi:hypothetical protein AB0D14_16405 [Streptomyces sp. NPDC048484]|uniref:hypothetical protein n=1 Tax=Streptomyces sp. NPDC048484 TaxID=3155146 RepID=UPI003421E96C
MPEYEGAEYGEAEYEGIDALLAAITDEPLPEGARDDARFMAEHRSAVADVALLREQLRIMGDTLIGEEPPPGEPPPGERAAGERAAEKKTGPVRVPARAPAPLRPPREARTRQSRRYRRYAGAAVGALAIAAGTALLGGLVWLGVEGGGGSGSNDASAAKQQDGGVHDYSPEMHLACAKVLVEGTVLSITPVGEGNVRVVLEAKRYYRPEQSVTDHPTITVTLLESARDDLKVGTYTLVRVPVYAQDRQDWETGWGVGDARKEILKALPGARGMKCAGPNEGRG